MIRIEEKQLRGIITECVRRVLKETPQYTIQHYLTPESLEEEIESISEEVKNLPRLMRMSAEDYNNYILPISRKLYHLAEFVGQMVFDGREPKPLQDLPSDYYKED